MILARTPSVVTVPPAGHAGTLLDFFAARFPGVGREVWEARFAAGRIARRNGPPASASEPCEAGVSLTYFREVEREPAVTGHEEIVLATDEFLIADKPAGLPVHPTGPFVRECLLARLAERLGDGELSAVHRLDLETRGLVLISRRRATRALYHALFAERRVVKEYRALAVVTEEPRGWSFTVENRLERGEPWFRMRAVPGPANARTLIELEAWQEGRGFFRLLAETGKKHQLRLHLAGLGFPILGDRLYPELRPAAVGDPGLALVACRLAFVDPVSGRSVEALAHHRLHLAGATP